MDELIRLIGAQLVYPIRSTPSSTAWIICAKWARNWLTASKVYASRTETHSTPAFSYFAMCGAGCGKVDPSGCIPMRRSAPLLMVVYGMACQHMELVRLPSCPTTSATCRGMDRKGEWEASSSTTEVGLPGNASASLMNFRWRAGRSAMSLEQVM